MRFFFVVSILILLCGIFASTYNINAEIVADEVYLNYIVDTNAKDLRLELFDPSKIIYINSDSNFQYDLNGNILNVGFTDNSQKILVFKYKSSRVAEEELYKSKTLVLKTDGETNISVSCEDCEITKTSPASENLMWKTDGEATIYLQIKSETNAFKQWAALIAAILVIAYFIFAIYKKRKRNSIIDKKSKNNTLLTENEQNIISTLKKQDGLMQQTIAEQLSLEKAHVSKLITKLERKDLIERKQVGKIKKIFLK